MKTKNNLIALTALILFSACSDFLDKDPLVQSSAETYYSNEQEANDATIGAYSMMQNEGFQLAPFMLIGDDCSDDCDLGNSNSEAFSWLGAVAQSLQKFDVLPTNWVSNALWSQGFTGITWTTQAIARIEGNENIPEAKRNQFVGEAHYLRAQYYFFLTRQYGRLPIIDHVLSYEEYYMPRATIEQTWAFMEADLQKAAQLLPEKSQYQAGDIGRATKGAANALLGRVYMYQKKFAEAYQVLKTVVASNQYGLEPKYEDIFALEHENGIESIFEIQHGISGTGWADSNEGSILSFYEHDADPEDMVKWHNGWSMHCPTENLVKSFHPGDPRLKATVIFPDEFFDGRIHTNKASSTGYQPKKWYIPYDQRSQIDQSDCPKNIIFYRYADVLLYLAEAANETGQTAEALQYLEQVRARARANAEDPSVLPEIKETGKDALRQLIWQERRVELACEGQRFWDLVRQGRAGTVMKNYAQTYNSIKGQYFVDGKSELFPIPETQVTLSNGSMEQNPGY
ncbi:MAG: RagB/SusD family nutrient uptake outer membrane protein [Tannerellaceae bacterium]|jgi:tetratricopeptide (TPR) repeat protein|nr:RagB/SusD family nutrient uptake outer membrane protein [Tannerellaceae bacterium]